MRENQPLWNEIKAGKDVVVRPPVPLPTTIRKRVFRDDVEIHVIRATVAERLYRILESLAVTTVEDLKGLPRGYVTMLGGRTYIKAALAWHDEKSRARGRSRQQINREAPRMPGESDADFD